MNIDVKTIQRSVVGHGLAHDSAAKQIAGEASYIDDMAELPGTLHAALVMDCRPMTITIPTMCTVTTATRT